MPFVCMVYTQVFLELYSWLLDTICAVLFSLRVSAPSALVFWDVFLAWRSLFCSLLLVNLCSRCFLSSISGLTLFSSPCKSLLPVLRCFWALFLAWHCQGCYLLLASLCSLCSSVSWALFLAWCSQCCSLFLAILPLLRCFLSSIPGLTLSGLFSSPYESLLLLLLLLRCVEIYIVFHVFLAWLSLLCPLSLWISAPSVQVFLELYSRLDALCPVLFSFCSGVLTLFYSPCESLFLLLRCFLSSNPGPTLSFLFSSPWESLLPLHAQAFLEL